MSAAVAEARRLGVALTPDAPPEHVNPAWLRDMERTDIDGFVVTTNIDLGFGGTDPLEFAETHAARVGHVHLKDVRLDVADRLKSGELSLMQAVQAGIFTPLGQGDVAVEGVVVAVRVERRPRDSHRHAGEKRNAPFHRVAIIP